ncbi:GNAT family N-acetyltransferase [uncultured Thomasclavelia sp.]|uniref:GNAT family N-acetyltransferase n=1 Tax=uncultured Thomasclavelia sp. TaxID=3025759 RepID=UPI0025E16F14|nr:GNAT family N-acetyltransferase [uncultured Thomasclavelia sp.]
MIRRAKESDLAGINNLLFQVNNVHADGRPDLFSHGGKKYNDEEVLEIINDDKRPIFVYLDENDQILGYVFCVYQNNYGDKITLYIDDLCVDENCRGQHVGTKLYNYVVDYAKENNIYHITLNVWCLNESAMKFYEKCGLKPLKVMMEKVL